MKTWLIADTHFCHDKIREYCGRPKGFEETVLKHLRAIPEGDVLIHLGDVCLGREADIHERYIQPVQCRKWLVRGNHDHKSNTWYLQHGWEFICEQFTGVYYGKRILFSHVPVAWDGCYEVNIHGHFHNCDRRLHEPELVKIHNSYQRLLAIEYTDLKPVTLENFLKEADASTHRRKRHPQSRPARG